MSWRLVLAACAVLILAFALRWLLPSDRVSRPAPELPDARFDYTLTDFSARFRDPEGRVELLVSGPRLEHDSRTRIATLIEPRFQISPDQDNWHGQARTGQLIREEDELILSGEVELHKPLAQGEIRISTPVLHHDRSARTIFAPEMVRIEQPGSRLQAGSMFMSINDDLIEFSNHVQGELDTADDNPASGRNQRP